MLLTCIVDAIVTPPVPLLTIFGTSTLALPSLFKPKFSVPPVIVATPPVLVKFSRLSRTEPTSLVAVYAVLPLKFSTMLAVVCP